MAARAQRLAKSRGGSRHHHHPYLFFWQASQEVEEEKAKGRRRRPSREGATKREILDREMDVGAGTFFSNLVMYFIILTAALTLHAHNDTSIENSRQVAEALKPLAGWFAATLYTIGLVGVGLLVIPILAGSSAYAFAETFAWKEGLDMPVINGVLAPFLLVGILIASCNRSLMRRQPSSWLSRVVVGLTAAIMFVAAGAMFLL